MDAFGISMTVEDLYGHPLTRSIGKRKFAEMLTEISAIMMS